MRKLLSANFARLVKGKLFWTLEAACCALSVIWYILAARNTHNMGLPWLQGNANYYFFLINIYIGIFLAIFASLFIGTEYADGVIRNKLSVGHRRRDIYLANLTVTIAVGFIFTLTHFAAAVLVGMPFAGAAAVTAIAPPVWRLGETALIVLVYAALFTLLAMADTNRSRVAVIALLLSLALALGGMAVYGKLHQPELTTRMVMQEDGSFLREENIPNPAYVSGAAREILTWFKAFLPSSQALQIANRDGTLEIRAPFCLAGTAVLLTFCGVKLFEKKDIQ